MRIKTIVICLLMVLCDHVQGQVLYEISGNNAAKKSYLLATNKLIDCSFIDTIPNAFTCFARSRCVITEFAMQDYEALAALRQAALLPDSVRLRSFYTDEEYTVIDQALTLTLDMGLEQLGRMKPAYLTEMYRTELMKKWLHYDEDRSMETFFERVAQETNIPIYGLDEVGETMYMLFDREPFDWQCKELKKVIEFPEEELRQERTIVAMYRQGRLNDISYQVAGPDNKTSISYSDYQVYCRRNQQWVKRLTPYLKEGACFITLNCVYLGGDEGLIAQLKAAGYKVRPVNRR